MKLSEYVEYMRAAAKDDCSLLYLKDWHFVRAFPRYKAYELPPYFVDDWLNEYFDVLGHDDYKFVYMGPKGSWTPFHADVLRSYSWSANVCGLKKWLLFRPGDESHLVDSLGNFPADITAAKRAGGARPIEVLQRAGEILFVPSGWYHQVHNLEDTISINHNWLNGCCIDHCWKYISQSLAEVKDQIQDCAGMEEWDSTCQTILKVQTGLDIAGFYELLLTIVCHRLEQLALLLQGSAVLDNMAAATAGTAHSLSPDFAPTPMPSSNDVPGLSASLSHVACQRTSRTSQETDRAAVQQLLLPHLPFQACCPAQQPLLSSQVLATQSLPSAAGGANLGRLLYVCHVVDSPATNVAYGELSPTGSARLLGWGSALECLEERGARPESVPTEPTSLEQQQPLLLDICHVRRILIAMMSSEHAEVASALSGLEPPAASTVLALQAAVSGDYALAKDYLRRRQPAADRLTHSTDKEYHCT